MAQAAIGGRRGRHPAVAAGLSLVVPGLGQLYAGAVGRGLFFLVPGVVAVVGAIVAVEEGVARLAALAVQPRVLWAVAVLNLLAVAWRVWAGVDAYLRTDAEARPGALAHSLLAVVAVVAASPHVVAAAYAVEAVSVLETVFDATPAADRPTDDEPTRPVVAPFAPGDTAIAEVLDPKLRSDLGVPTERSTRNMIFWPGVGDPEAIEARPEIIGGPPPHLHSLIPDAERRELERITILLAGGDGGPGRGGARTDSIMVATLDTTTGKAAIFGIPRNLVQVPLREDYADAFVDLEKRITPRSDPRWVDTDGDGRPDEFHSCHCFPDQINAIYPFTRKWTETYPNEPDPGMAVLRDTLELMLGIHIDHYAFVNMSGFVSLVDALGGVRVYVTGRVQAEVSPARQGEDWITVDIAPGWRRLDGHEALAYVRERKSVSDYVRMRRQRCMLKALAAQADPARILTRFPRIAKVVKRSVHTDIPIEMLPRYVEELADLDFSDIATVGFGPPDFAPTSNHRRQPIPDLEAIRAEVRRILDAGPDTSFGEGRETECRI